MSLTDYAENKILDHVFSATTWTMPSIWIAASTTTPTDAGGNITEPSGNNYARKAWSTWNTPASRAITNDGDIEFNAATGSWGTITHFVLYDASTSGNALAWGAVTGGSIVITTDDTLRFLDEQLSVSMNSGGWGTVVANALVAHIVGKTSYTRPTIYAGLSTANPGDSGSALAEPSTGSYARVAHSAWTSAASGSLNNSGTITFPDPTGSWGTITYFALFDASTSGNIIRYGALNTSKSPTTGDTVRVNNGGLIITQD